MISKAQAEYVDKARTARRRCGNCTMYVATGRCTLVEGSISTHGVCKHFKARDYHPMDAERRLP